MKDTTARNVWGYIIIIIGVILVLSGKTIPGIVVGIIGFVIKVNKSGSNMSSNENKPIMNKSLHCTVGCNSGKYSTILNSLEQIVDSVARRCIGREVAVMIMVRKINAVNCDVSFQMENINYKNYNITFGNEFLVSGDLARFETKLATGFTTPNAVKNELLLQFNWSDISVNTNQLDILDYGDFKETPMIIFRFSAEYVG